MYYLCQSSELGHAGSPATLLWMSRWIAAVLCMTGCVSQIHKLDPGWDGSTAPDCTESDGLVAGDALVGGVGLAIGEAAASSGSGLGLLSLLAGAGFAVAAAVGEQEVHSCRVANAEWRIGNAAGARATQHERRPEQAAPAPAAPPPRGFYCTASATHAELGRCARDRATCEQARGLAADAIPDLSPCTLVETATCFARSCYPSAEACAAHRGPDSIGDCVEQR
jgi:hypothetical protein